MLPLFSGRGLESSEVPGVGLICLFLLPSTQLASSNKYLLNEREKTGFSEVLIFSVEIIGRLSCEMFLMVIRWFLNCTLSCHTTKCKRWAPCFGRQPNNCDLIVYWATLKSRGYHRWASRTLPLLVLGSRMVFTHWNVDCEKGDWCFREDGGSERTLLLGLWNLKHLLSGPHSWSLLIGAKEQIQVQLLYWKYSAFTRNWSLPNVFLYFSQRKLALKFQNNYILKVHTEAEQWGVTKLKTRMWGSSSVIDEQHGPP